MARNPRIARKINNPLASRAVRLQELTDDLTEERALLPAVPDALLDEALLPQEDGTFLYKRFLLTGTGLQIPPDATEDEFAEVGRILLGMHGSIAWLLGDWLAYGEERKWGETYARLAAEYGYEVETLWSYASVCRRINSLIRIKEVDFSKARLVMSLEPDAQRYWLEQCALHKWSVAEMRDYLARWRRGETPALDDGMMRRRTEAPLIGRVDRLNIAKFFRFGSKITISDLSHVDERKKQEALETARALRRVAEDIERALGGE